MRLDESYLLDDVSALETDGRRGAGAYVTEGTFKRVFDVVVSVLILAALWPLLLVLSLVQLVLFRGKVLSFQSAVGQAGCSFAACRFFTDEKSAWSRFLTKSGLARLPELMNVLLGDMSIVGPKPRSIDDFKKSYKFAGLYMKARPGITGPWLVSSERRLGYFAVIRLDRGYIMRATMITDILILLQTPFTAFQKTSN